MCVCGGGGFSPKRLGDRKKEFQSKERRRREASRRVWLKAVGAEVARGIPCDGHERSLPCLYCEWECASFVRFMMKLNIQNDVIKKIKKIDPHYIYVPRSKAEICQNINNGIIGVSATFLILSVSPTIIKTFFNL